MFLFCCSGKKKIIKSNLENFQILENLNFNSSQESNILGKQQFSFNVKVDQDIINMQIYHEKIILKPINQNTSKNIKTQNLAKYLDLTKDHITFSVIYDLSFKEKYRKCIGIKFVNYEQTKEELNQQKLQQYKLINTSKKKEIRNNSNSVTNINEQKTNYNSQKSNLHGIDENYEKYPNICIYFEDNALSQNQIEKIFRFLGQKINQSDFRSIYKTIEVLGEGSSGTVFNVLNRNTLQQYASKVISKEELMKDENSYEAIKQEIQLMKECQSDYMLKIHQVFEDAQNLYLIIDLFNGGTLQSKLSSKKKRIMNVSEIQRIMKQILQGLMDLHEKKIMHRDIKPDNILFKSSSSLQLVICDLGLATKWDLKQYLFQNVGTPGYVAPEVYSAKGQYTGICDVYSCGVVLFQLLFHQLPFQGDSVGQILKANKKSQINYDKIQVKNKVQQIGLELIKQMLETDIQKRISCEKCLQNQFFSLSKEDQNIQVSDEKSKEQINSSMQSEKEKQKELQLNQKVQRQEIKEKYNFIIPNTPLMGKKAYQFQNFTEVCNSNNSNESNSSQLRDKSESLAIQNYNLPKAKIHNIESIMSLEQQGSPKGGLRFRNNLSNQGSPTQNLLKHTLMQKANNSLQSSPKSNHESLKQQKYLDGNQQQNIQIDLNQHFDLEQNNSNNSNNDNHIFVQYKSDSIQQNYRHKSITETDNQELKNRFKNRNINYTQNSPQCGQSVQKSPFSQYQKKKKEPMEYEDNRKKIQQIDQRLKQYL